jgi:rubrerythrin
MEKQAYRKDPALTMTPEAVHAKLCAVALAAVAQGRDLAETQLFLCPVCGHIEPGEPPVSCLVCGTLKEDFVHV